MAMRLYCRSETYYMEVVRHVNDIMSCWTIVEHVYGTITLKRHWPSALANH